MVQFCGDNSVYFLIFSLSVLAPKVPSLFFFYWAFPQTIHVSVVYHRVCQTVMPSWQDFLNHHLVLLQTFYSGSHLKMIIFTLFSHLQYMGLLLFLGVKMLSPEPQVASQTLSFLLCGRKCTMQSFIFTSGRDALCTTDNCPSFFSEVESH